MNIALTRGATRKIVQLVGEEDRQFPTRSPLTFTNFQLFGTDVGAPLDLGPGRELRLLFGDAWMGKEVHDGLIRIVQPEILDGRVPGKTGDEIALAAPYSARRPYNADPIGVVDASVTAQSIGPDLRLTFMRTPDPDDTGYATLDVPGVSLLTNAVPTGAINTPGGVYVFVTGRQFVPGGPAKGVEPQRSWIARWSNLEGTKLDPPSEFSRDRFANFLCPVVGGIGEVPGHPRDGQVVWLWGTGFPNRNSSVRLAYAPLAQVGNRQAWRFFTRVSAGEAQWDPDESQARRLFENSSIGEFSVAWLEQFGVWVMLYACPDPRGILLRWSHDPWGPWTEGIVILDPRADNAYGRFMHEPGRDLLSDPNREGDIGGEYAPVVISRFTLAQNRNVALRYLLSTWNPYTVVLIESVLSGSQAGWRFCRKCQGLFLPTEAGHGVCAADHGPHDARESGKYVVAFGESAPSDPDGPPRNLSAQQGGWRRCRACWGLFFSGNRPNLGHCPARVIPIEQRTPGGPEHRPHDPVGSGHYAISFDDGRSNLGQQSWRFCRKCQGLFFGTNPAAGMCPADGRPHDSTESGKYQLAFEDTPV